MPGINDLLLDAVISHQVDLSQYGEGVVRKIVSILNKADADLFALLTEALDRLPRDSFTIQRLDAVLTSVRAMNTAAYNSLGQELTREMENLALFEVEYQKSLFDTLLPVQVTVGTVLAPQVFAAAMAEPFQGRLMSEWFQGLSSARAQRLRDAISMGYTQNETIPQIVSRVRGTKAQGYADGALEVDRRHASAIARTAISHVSGFARDRFYEKNKDIVSTTVWISTLDLRTSSMCQVRDGLKYTVEEHKPVGHEIPWLGGPGRLHWNCRSSSTLIIKSWEDLGLAGSELPASSRASMDGQVPEDTTYLKWLSKQSAARQDEILGPSRGSLLRDGKLSPDRFWDDRGNYLTLDDLRARQAKAFQKAGL